MERRNKSSIKELKLVTQKSISKNLKITASSALCFGCSRCSLKNHSKETNDHCEQRNSFYQCGSKDHVAADIIQCFRLTGNSFNSSLSDLAHTNTGSHSCKTGTYGTTCICYSF